MIINDPNQSSLSEYTNRTFLLQKEDKHRNQSLCPNIEQLRDIIRDKSIWQNPHENEDVQRAIYRFYQRFKMIRPESPFIVVWNIMIMLIIIFYLMEFPLILGYGQVVWQDISTYLFPLLVVLEFIMLWDMLITPLKMRYREGLLIRDRKILIKEYVKFNFWIDSVGLIALLVPLVFRQYYAVNLIKIFFLPKVIILNQLDSKVVSVLVFQVKTKTFYLIGRLIVFMIMISHYIGIGFYMVGYYIYSTNYYGPNTPNICWLYNAEAYSQIILLLDWKGQYAYTMYFSLGMTTTIAYGDITPLNPIEALYIVFALVINTIAFGYILSEVMRILIQAFYAEFDKNNLKYTMESILVGRKIKHKLRQAIRAQMEQIAKEQMYRNRKIQREVISSLPFNLQIGLYSKIYQQFMQNLNLSPDTFYTDKNRNSRFIEKILLQITESRYLVGDLIYKEDQIYTEEFNNHKTYFFKDKTNITDVILGVGKSPSINLENRMIENQNQHMLFFSDRPFFGEVEFLTGNARSHWVMSKNNFLLYELSRKSFLLNLRYASRKELQHLSELRETIFDSFCYICYGRHSFKKCTKTTLVPSITEAILRINERQKMRRRHNSKIQDVRTQKRNISAKTNALRIYKKASTSKDRKSLQRSKIRLLASSKHYRRVYYQEQRQGQEQHPDDTSSGSSQDLEYMIEETKMLILNLNKVGSNQEQEMEDPIFEYEFDSVYHFKGYKAKDNFQNVLNRLSDLQKILMSKRKISMILIRR